MFRFFDFCTNSIHDISFFSVFLSVPAVWLWSIAVGLFHSCFWMLALTDRDCLFVCSQERTCRIARNYLRWFTFSVSSICVSAIGSSFITIYQKSRHVFSMSAFVCQFIQSAFLLEIWFQQFEVVFCVSDQFILLHFTEFSWHRTAFYAKVIRQFISLKRNFEPSVMLSFCFTQ